MTAPAQANLLLVEDDDVAAEAVVRGLRKHGLDWPVVVAGDGAAALAILRGTHPALRLAAPRVMLLDLNLPGMNGYELLQELRTDAELRPTVVFVLTASSAAADVERAYRECVAGYLVKSNLGPQLQGLARFLAEYGRISALPPPH